MKRIVLTGGPGSGKTTLALGLEQENPDRYCHVPEAATQVYKLLNTRWDRLTVAGRRDVQLRIYQLQLQQEDELARQHPSKHLLIDRGTIDGSSYWPEGPQDYWNQLDTTLAEQYARYDLVVWLETSAAIGLYDGPDSNPCRHERPQTAIALGEAQKQLWSAHPRFHCVRAFPDLADKLAAVRAILRRGQA